MSKDGTIADLRSAMHRFEKEVASMAPPDDPEDPGPQPDPGRDGAAGKAAHGPQVIIPSKAPFETWQPLDPATLPPRRFIYGHHYIRGFASVTVAPGGLGKSLLVLAECIAIATGRPILGIQPEARQRVVYFNAEDPKEEIQRRVLAICQHYGIDQEELRGWLWIASGRETELILATGDSGEIVESVFALLEAFAREVKPALFVLDPLANMTESPETNDVFRRLGKRLSRFAEAYDCAVELIHHTRKLNGRAAEIEDSRGGGALVGAVRAGRVLNPMSAEDAAKVGLDTHMDHFRIEAAGKNNLARPSPQAQWFQRVDIRLANGDQVAAVEKWDWPDAFKGVSTSDARRVQLAIAAMKDKPPHLNSRAKEWAGKVVARVLELDLEKRADKARAQSMLKTWIKTGVLVIEEAHDTRAGRPVKVVLAGPNSLTSEVST